VCTGSNKHRSEGIKQHEIITIRGKQGQGLMETDGGFWPHHGQGGFPDAH